MTVTGIVVAMAAVVLGVEVVMGMMSGVTTHLWPGGFMLFSVVGALVLIRVAKGIAAAGVQQPAVATDDHDE
jgi:hypothetical protein